MLKDVIIPVAPSLPLLHFIRQNAIFESRPGRSPEFVVNLQQHGMEIGS